MNERIKELAKQAGMRFDRFGMVIPTTLTVQETVNLEKFAELIVRECMQVAEASHMSTPEDCVYYVDLAVGRIGAHFGVEE